MRIYKILTVLFILVFIFAPSIYGDEKYKYCEIWGIAGGADDHFIQTIAGRILQKQGLYHNETCGAVMRDAYQFGKKFATGSQLDEGSVQRWKKYQDFRDKVADKIIDLVGY